MKNFKERIAVVTGAASGIGLALAERFAAQGMKVVMASRGEGIETAPSPSARERVGVRVALVFTHSPG